MVKRGDEERRVRERRGRDRRKRYRRGARGGEERAWREKGREK